MDPTPALASPAPHPADVPARHPPLTAAGLAAVAYLGLAGALLLAWQHHAAGAVAGGAWLVALAPVLLAAACAASSQADREQYAARLLAAALMGPILLLFWSLDGPLAWGPGLAVALGGVALHATACVAAVAWLARLATCIAPAPDVPVADVQALRRRLVSFGALGLPLELRQSPGTGTLHLRWQPPHENGQWHAVHLHADAATGAVQVLERMSADGDAPASAEQASMRSVGDDPFVPARPVARRVWLRTLQTTMLGAERLAAAPVALAADRVVWTADGSPTLPDTKALMACLAAVVVRSGWTWRPQLLA